MEVFAELSESPGARRFRITFDLGKQALAINDPISRQGRAGNFSERGEQVRSVREIFVQLARGADALPTDDEGDEPAAFLHAALLSDEATAADGCAVSVRFGGAVVAHEEDDGVVAEFKALQFGEEFADEFVHVSDVIVVELDVAGGGVCAGRGRRAVGRGQDLRMHERQRVVEEEGFALVGVDEVEGALLHQVGHVFRVRHRQLFLVDVVRAGIGADPVFGTLFTGERILFDPTGGGGFVPIDAAGLVAQDVVETPIRRISRGQYLAPFANHRGGVASLLQDRGNHDFGFVAGAKDGTASVLGNRA